MRREWNMTWNQGLAIISAELHRAATTLTGRFIANDKRNFLAGVNSSAKGPFGVRQKATQGVSRYGHDSM